MAIDALFWGYEPCLVVGTRGYLSRVETASTTCPDPDILIGERRPADPLRLRENWGPKSLDHLSGRREESLEWRLNEPFVRNRQTSPPISPESSCSRSVFLSCDHSIFVSEAGNPEPLAP